MVDISRATSGVSLPTELSQQIWQSAQEQSVVMRLAPRMPLPGAGTTIHVITGDPEPEWTAETGKKPVKRPNLDNKVLRGYTLAVIVPFSNQFRRDLSLLYGAIVDRLPGALAKKFDQTVFFGAAPGSDFDTLASAPAVSINNVAGTQTAYDGFVAALASVAVSGDDLTGWALSPQGEVMALGAKDDNGRPLFIDNPQTEGSVGSVLGRPAYRSRAVYQAGDAGTGTPETLGFGGDWSYAVWGQVEDIQISVTDQATISDGDSTINLWEQNMFAVRAEFEVGFRVRDVNAFARLTGAIPS